MNGAEGTERTYRILIADDQTLTREGLKVILDSEADFSVVGEARNGLEAVERARALEPDLVLMDVRMPLMNGIASLRQIKEDLPRTVVLILTTFAEDEYIADGLAAGADGYLLKDMERERLVASIRDAASGQFVLQGVVARMLARRLLASDNKAVAQRAGPAMSEERPAAGSGSGADSGADSGWGSPRFTDREEDVARLLLAGLNNSDIGLRMGLSDGTVRNYISSIYAKLGVNSRAKAILSLQRRNES